MLQSSPATPEASPPGSSEKATAAGPSASPTSPGMFLAPTKSSRRNRKKKARLLKLTIAAGAATAGSAAGAASSSSSSESAVPIVTPMSLFEALPEFGIKARVQTLLKVLAKCSPVTYADAIAAAAARAAPQSAADGDAKAGSSQQAGGSVPAKQIDQSLLASLPSMIKDIGRALPSEVRTFR